LKKKIVLCLAWKEKETKPEEDPSQVGMSHWLYSKMPAPMEFIMESKGNVNFFQLIFMKMEKETLCSISIC
jgi:hypothetical protein